MAPVTGALLFGPRFFSVKVVSGFQVGGCAVVVVVVVVAVAIVVVMVEVVK